MSQRLKVVLYEKRPVELRWCRVCHAARVSARSVFRPFVFWMERLCKKTGEVFGLTDSHVCLLGNGSESVATFEAIVSSDKDTTQADSPFS